MPDTHILSSLDDLARHYGEPHPFALRKEAGHLTPEYRKWLEATRYFAIASMGPKGLDCSPRGDRMGELLQILDAKTLAIPDRRGNNRLDTLKNIIQNPQVALLFLIPGINEALRINGTAKLSIAADLIDRFDIDGKKPATVIVVSIQTVFFQCGRAVKRAGLWDQNAHTNQTTLPTAGQMLKSAIPEFDPKPYDADLPKRQKETLY